MITKLELKNFQKHDKLELNFDKGINLIKGESGSGKSVVVRALRWIFFNDISSNAIRKQGSKKTVVTVTFDSGPQIERIKSSSINAYIIREGEKETRFDAVGKTIPEEVLEILRTRLISIDGLDLNLNIDGQFDSPFLIGKEFSATFRAKLFNLLTGNDLQDKIFKDLNKDAIGINRKKKTEEEEIESLTSKKANIKKDLLSKEQDYAVRSKAFKSIVKKYDRYITYVELSEQLTKNKEEQASTRDLLNKLEVIDTKRLTEISKLIDRYETLNRLSKRLFKAQTQINATKDDISKISLINVDFGGLNAKIQRLQTLEDLYIKLMNNTENRLNTKTELKDIKINIETLNKEYDAKIKELNLCDHCPLRS